MQHELIEALKPLRDKIDDLDDHLISLIHQRLQLTDEVANIKKQLGQPVYQPERKKEIILSRKQKAERVHLSSQFIELLFNLIMNESCRLQDGIINN